MQATHTAGLNPIVTAVINKKKFHRQRFEKSLHFLTFSKLFSFILLSIFLQSSQAQFFTTATTNNPANTVLIDSIHRKLKHESVNELLTYYLVPRQLDFLTQHGCWCAKILNENSNELGGSTPVDDLDIICKQWSVATKCIHSLGQNCYQYDQQPTTDISIETGVNGLQISTQCEIPSNDDLCLQDACKVHTYFANKIAEEINNNSYVLFHGSEEFCRGGRGVNQLESVIMQCSGTADEPATLHFSALQCTCENGNSAVGNDCPGAGSEVCSSCNEGYHLDGNTCSLDVCNCDNGVAATGSSCPLNNSTYCDSCNVGYSIIQT